MALLVACPGSGAGILAGLLAAEPGVAVAGDDWRAAAASGQASDRLTREHAGEQLTERLRGTAGEPGHGGLMLVHDPRLVLQVPFWSEVFPRARVVHLVRDGRDVACALEPEPGQEWPGPRPPGWPELVARADGLARGALIWRETMAVALADLDAVSHLTVRYEDLVADPQHCRRQLLSHLGLSERPDDRDQWNRFAQLATNQAAPAGGAVETWHRLAAERRHELEVVNGLLAATLERLGYDSRPPEIARPQELTLPRWARFEQRRLTGLASEQEARLQSLERRGAELESRLRSLEVAARRGEQQVRRAEVLLDRALRGLKAIRAARGWRLATALARLARPLASRRRHDSLEEAIDQLRRARSVLGADSEPPRDGSRR